MGQGSQPAEIRAFQSHTARYRPTPGGVSIGHKDITAGTLGCLVKKGGEFFILSNNHVLANSNAAQGGPHPILQPGPYDGGRFSRRPHCQSGSLCSHFFHRRALGFGLADVCTHVSFWRIQSVFGGMLVVNKAKFDGLPPDLKRALLDTGREAFSSLPASS